MQTTTQRKFPVRQYLLLLLMGLLVQVSQAQTRAGDLTLRTQSDVNALAGQFPFKILDGNLTIDPGLSLSDPILNLSTLQGLGTVTGDVRIEYNTELVNLTDLSNLDNVGGNLYITNNARIKALVGLEKLSSIGKSLRLWDNPELQSLAGLQTLPSIGGSLSLINNLKLTSLNGILVLKTITGSLTIAQNPVLTNISALTTVTSVGGNLDVSENPQLASCCVLQPILAAVAGTKTIAGNAASCSSESAIAAACAPVLTLSGLSPTRNARNVDPAMSVTVTASAAFADNATTKAALRVFSSQAGGRKAGSATVSGANLAFDPGSDFRAGETVFATVTTGSGLTKPQVYQFTTAVKPSPGTFSSARNYALKFYLRNLTVADIDGDNDPDIIISSSSGSELMVSRNNGGGVFGTPTNYAVGSDPFEVEAADIDGDGDLDLISANFNSQNVSVLHNDGNGNFDAAINYPVGNYPVSVLAADVNGDGHQDLITTNVSGGNTSLNNISVILNSGNDSFGTPVLYLTGLFPYKATAADIDSDGDLDLLVANEGSDNVSVLRNNGDGSFGTATNYAAENGATSVAHGDIDGDGDLDLVTANLLANTASVFRNDGSGNFGTPANYTVGSGPLAGNGASNVSLADIDGDGDLDLVTVIYDGNSVSILRNDGSGVFGTPTNYAVGGNPYDVEAADIDGDGDLDLISSNFYTGDVSVLFNQTSEPTATTVAAASATYGASSVNLVATVSPVPDGGSVRFYRKASPSATDSTDIGTASLANGSYTLAYSLSGLKAGTYSITAVYSGNTGFEPSIGRGTLTISKAELTVTAASASRQYSDPNPTFAATYSGFVANETLATSGVTGTPQLSSAATASSAPGPYPISISLGTLQSDNYTFKLVAGTLTVLPEDAVATYTGSLFVATPSTKTSTATVLLSATIQDITAVPGSLLYDAFAGDVKKATVVFRIEETGQEIPAAIGYVNSSDPKTGIATASWTASLGSDDSQSFTVRVKVSGYYRASDYAVITVSKSVPGLVTGGGYVLLSKSAGEKSGQPGSKNNFGFSVINGKNGVKGRLNTIVRRTENGVLRSYQIKATAMNSLTLSGRQATFEGKGVVQDITDPLNVLSVDGNAALRVQMTDNGEPGSADLLAVTILNKNGGLWFASNWDGTRTVQQLLAGGNLKVNAGAAARVGVEETQLPLSVVAYPNPVGGELTVQLSQPLKQQVSVTLIDQLGHRSQVGTLQAGQQQLTVDMRPRAMGVYVLAVQGEGFLHTIRLVKADQP